MQSAPLAGTATHPKHDTFRQTQRCNPHPSRGRQPCIEIAKIHIIFDAIRTPRGDGNSIVRSTGTANFMMQSAPLAGTATFQLNSTNQAAITDAIRTPRGDGNPTLHGSTTSRPGCNPQAPSHLPIPRRFASANRGASSKAARFFRHRRRFASFPSRGRQPKIKTVQIQIDGDAIRRHYLKVHLRSQSTRRRNFACGGYLLLAETLGPPAYL